MRALTILVAAMALLLPGRMTMAKNGLVTVQSSHTVPETIDRLRATLVKNGVTIFAQIDHAAGAHQVNLALRPTLLLIFGDPKDGTPLMAAAQPIGIDLPMKMLAWEDAAGKVWLSYNDPLWLGERHGLPIEQSPRLNAFAAGLERLAKAAAAP